MDFKKDYYAILNLQPNSSKDEIRAAYRRLVKQHHPDRNPGSPEAEARIKEINEAYDILSNDISRHVYDEFKQQEAALRQEQEVGADVGDQNKKTYYRTDYLRKEERIYVRGHLVVKFWGVPEGGDSLEMLHEVTHKIHPTDVRVRIEETSVHPLAQVPTEYQHAFRESDLFQVPLAQPIKCTVVGGIGEEHYHLQLLDIRVKDPRITNVTKHEGESLGTLEGTIYGYVVKVTYDEVQVPVTECFGPTGREEEKWENGRKYVRKEYFYPNCTTYWSAWEAEPVAPPEPEQVRKRTRPSTPTPPAEGCLSNLGGCLQWWWLLPIIALLILQPKAFLGLLALALVGIVLNLLGALFSVAGRLLWFIVALLLLGLLIGGIRSCTRSSVPYVPRSKSAYDTVESTFDTVRRIPRSANDTTKSLDTLITHYIRWKDYDSTRFDARLSISLADLRQARIDHENFTPYLSSLAPVYSFMRSTDDQRLSRVYAQFDSIRAVRQLDEAGFARMLVSCVQSIPFALVVDRSCQDSYDDEYIRNYLATCSNGTCCVGYSKFGVRSPVEFLSDLKGDCDTRSLLIYTLLQHYGYDVALLTSQYYKHALIAVHFRSSVTPAGVAMSIRNRNYLLWETTSAGFNAGNIPMDLTDLDRWEIALLHENE